jgi:hypothetical protein
MDTENTTDAIIRELRDLKYFSIKDNSAKTKIRDELAKKHNVESVWIKDVVINGLGKEGRRIEEDKIKNALGLAPECVRQIDKEKDDPAEGLVHTQSPDTTIYYVSSAPGQAGIGLFKALNALKSPSVDYAVVIINNGNEGPIADGDYLEIKETLGRLGIYAAGVYSLGVSHIAGITLNAKPTLQSQSALLSTIHENFVKNSASILGGIHLNSNRIIASLLTKRFLILTGLSGSGKTKIAQAFARWISATPGWSDEADHSKGKNINPYYSLVPVGADWTGNDNVLGYPDGIRDKTYNSKPALDLILHAAKKENKDKPHFLILDEMNLSHVERYFSDILSAIESGEPIPLHSGVDLKSGVEPVPRTQVLPPNLFIIGTVNVDETTYMFSPKVLDRANVIEFRMDETELIEFLEEPKAVLLDELDGKGEPFGKLFATAAADKTRSVPEGIKPKFKQEMLLLFNLLQKHQAEFGYRTSYEAARFVHFYKELGGFSDETDEYFAAAMDAVIVQKLLPKLHGSRSKLEGLLWALIQVCAAKRPADMIAFTKTCHEAGKADSEALAPKHFDAEFEKETPDVLYPLSFNKLMRMHRKLVRDQFVTFSEA